MNRYGKQARAHWMRWRPREIAEISDPDAFFSDLGDRVAEQVETTAMSAAGPDVPGEGYLGKLGRLRMARFTAEEQVLRELVLLPPEPGHPDAEDLEEGPGLGAPWVSEWMPMSIGPGDPAWALLGLDRDSEDAAQQTEWEAQDRALALSRAPQANQHPTPAT